MLINKYEFFFRGWLAKRKKGCFVSKIGLLVKVQNTAWQEKCVTLTFQISCLIRHHLEDEKGSNIFMIERDM